MTLQYDMAPLPCSQNLDVDYSPRWGFFSETLAHAPFYKNRSKPWIAKTPVECDEPCAVHVEAVCKEGAMCVRGFSIRTASITYTPLAFPLEVKTTMPRFLSAAS